MTGTTLSVPLQLEPHGKLRCWNSQLEDVLLKRIPSNMSRSVTLAMRANSEVKKVVPDDSRPKTDTSLLGSKRDVGCEGYVRFPNARVVIVVVFSLVVVVVASVVAVLAIASMNAVNDESSLPSGRGWSF